MRRLCFSVVATFTGQHPRLADYCPCDTTLADVIRESPAKLEPGEPFDSEYNYLAREGYLPDRILDRLEECSGETKFQICAKLKELFPRESFWACIADAQLNGIFDRDTIFKFFDAIGAEFDTENTMGTLGGPLAPCGIVPDLAYNVKSHVLIASIRITPCLCEKIDGRWQPCRTPSEWQWNRILAILKNSKTYDLKRHQAFAEEVQNES